MIVDWVRHCEWMKDSKAVGTKDASERKTIHKQEVMFIRYLHENCGYTKYQCFCEWRQLVNGTASKMKGFAAEQKQEFNRSFKQTSSFSGVNLTKRLDPVVIYKNELLFLNELKAPLWMKQYWGALLVYYKFEIQNSPAVYKSATVNAWCMLHSDHKAHRYGGVCQDAIAKKQIEMQVRVINDLPMTETQKNATYFPAFLATGGEIECVIESIDDVDDVLKRIKPAQSICPRCGKSFDLSPRCKREVCETCYREYRRGYLTESKRMSRNRQKDSEK